MSTAQPIIVKKKKNVTGGGHHGGAWKVAYADFVTAMMAFFLLMWLLNATSEEQRKGLADYFDPSLPISRTSAGGTGVLGGDTIFMPPEASGSREDGIRPQPTDAELGEDLGDLRASPDLVEGESVPDTVPISRGTEVADGDHQGRREGDGELRDPLSGTGEGTAASDADAAQRSADPGADGARPKQARETIEAVQEDLATAARAFGSEGLLKHFSMRVTPEGLVIEITDVTNEPLFSSGNAQPEPVLQTLMTILTPVLAQTTNDIAVSGHTDATPFVNRTDYSNWELSADRANVARRLLGASGLSAGRIVRVSGRAATNPIDPDPFSTRNRRISLTLLRSAPDRSTSGQ